MQKKNQGVLFFCQQMTYYESKQPHFNSLKLLFYSAPEIIGDKR